MKKIIFVAMIFLCAVLSGCKTMQLYVESVDRYNPPEHFSYPMAVFSGKTTQFGYEIVDGKVYLDVEYPVQHDFWLPYRDPQVIEDIDLEARIDCECLQDKEKLSYFSATITVLDEKGENIEPYRTESKDWDFSFYFKKGTLPKKITVKYTACFVFDGKEKLFSYTAKLKRKNLSLLRLKLLNAFYM